MILSYIQYHSLWRAVKYQKLEHVNRYVISYDLIYRSTKKPYLPTFRQLWDGSAFGVTTCFKNLVEISCHGSNYIQEKILKLFIEWLGFYPSIANVISSCIVVLISYLLQKKFTFK